MNTATINQRLVTIPDIAFAAGVSRTTVSLVMNGKAAQYRISTATRQRVEAVIAQSGYQPNRMARNMRLGRGTLVGLILVEGTPDVGGLIAGLEPALAGAGYSLVVSSVSFDPATVRERIQRLNHDGLAGLIYGPGIPVGPAPILAGLGPTIILGLPAAGLPGVFHDDEPGGQPLSTGSRRSERKRGQAAGELLLALLAGAPPSNRSVPLDVPVSAGIASSAQPIAVPVSAPEPQPVPQPTVAKPGPPPTITVPENPRVTEIPVAQAVIEPEPVPWQQEEETPAVGPALVVDPPAPEPAAAEPEPEPIPSAPVPEPDQPPVVAVPDPVPAPAEPPPEPTVVVAEPPPVVDEAGQASAEPEPVVENTPASADAAMPAPVPVLETVPETVPEPVVVPEPEVSMIQVDATENPGEPPLAEDQTEGVAPSATP